MTIHKSKGLEFENVIVLDRLGKEKSNSSSLIFDYDGVELKNIYYKMKGREKVDSEYKLALLKDESLDMQDKKNVEYVAFTRAKNALFIIKKQKSAFVSANKLEVGSFGVFEAKEKEDKNKNSKKFDLELKYYGMQEGVKEKEYKPNDYEAIYLGLAMHYAYEVEDFDAVMNRYGIYTDVKKAYELYESSKDKITFKGIYYKEVPFVFEGKEGVIDLMIENEDEVVIVDYKSTRPSDESGYVNQVKTYMNAIKNLKNKPTRGFIFYVDEKEFREVK